MGIPHYKCYPTYMYQTENKADADNLIAVYMRFEKEKLQKDPSAKESLTNSMRTYFRAQTWYRAQTV
jgi:hypothetical protein